MKRELTNKEKQVLRLSGYPRKEIAKKLCITLGTVQDHLTHIRRKLGVKSREQSLIVALNYIKQQDYKRNREWFDERGIKQKLILLPIYLHQIIHYQGIKNPTNKEFKKKYKISRYDLVFNRRYSKY